MILTPVLNIIQEHAYMLKNICATSEKDYREQEETVDEYFFDLANKIRDLYPPLLQINYDEEMSAEVANEVLKDILNFNRRNYAIDSLFYTTTPFCYLNLDAKLFPHMAVPAVLKLYGDNSCPNLMTRDQGLQTLIFNLLISLPPHSIIFSFVDFSLSGKCSEFVSALRGNGTCNDIITDRSQFDDMIKRLSQRQIEVLQKYGNIIEYNKQHQIIEMPYEVVVLLDYPNGYEENNTTFHNLLKNGHKGGIHFVINSESNYKEDQKTQLIPKEYLINYEREYSWNTYMNSLAPTFLYDIESIKQAVFNYYGSAIEEKEDVVVQDVDELSDSEYSDDTCNMTVPIGSSSDGKMDFRFDTVSHPHAFIIGQSGSGKSVLLHNIVSSMILKYTPEDLQLYLLDFKMGGVEFNRYRTINNTSLKN